MQHPSNEELLLYLEKAGSPEQTKAVKAHLKTCPECAAEIAGWERTAKKLQEFDWPTTAAVRQPIWSRMIFKLAAAAVIMAGLGFGLGRATGAPPAKVKAAITRDLLATLGPQLKAELTAGLEAAQRQQEQNQTRLAALLEQVQQQHAEDIFSLRHDLETAVTAADQDLKQNRQRLTELAATVWRQAGQE